MKNKFIISIIIFIVLSISLCSYCLANNDMMNNARNTVMNVGNSIANGATDIVNGAATLGNDALNTVKNVGNSAMNTAENMGNDAENSVDSAVSTLNTDNGDYTATRTATNNNFLGMSDNTWTWLILGAVGLAIVGLVWYYNAQYEHKNYNND